MGLPCILVFASVLLSVTFPAAGADSGTPLRLIVPFAAGGPADGVTRLVAARLGPLTGRPVVIDNRGGAGGNLGAEAVAKAVPDGNTLLATTTALVTAPYLYRNTGFDPIRDFVPVSPMAKAGFVLLASKQSGIRTLAELVAAARKGSLTHGSAGSGTPIHLTAELLKQAMGIQMLHVPYKGSAPALLDLAGGRIDTLVDATVTGLRQAAGGTATAIAVTTERRLPSAPDVPTFAESGYPGFEATLWYAVFAPARTPPAAIAELRGRFEAALRDPELATQFRNLGAEAYEAHGDEFAATMKRDAARWADIIRTSGARVE